MRLVGDAPDAETLRLQFAVAERGFHAEQLRERTGLEVGEGQATILLNDLRAFHGHVQQRQQEPISDEAAAQPLVGRGVPPGDGRGPTPPWAGSATRSRPTATCSRCGGC